MTTHDGDDLSERGSDSDSGGDSDSGWAATEAVLECYIATGAWPAARSLCEGLARARAAGRLPLSRDEEMAWRLLELEAQLQPVTGLESGDALVPLRGSDGLASGPRGPERSDGAAVLLDTLRICALRGRLDERRLAAAALLETQLLRREGRPADALAAARRHLRAATDRPPAAEAKARLLLAAAGAAEQLGESGEAERLARRALGAARRSGPAGLAGEALLILGRQVLSSGRCRDALPLLLSARSELRRSGRLYLALLALLLLARARWCAGDVDAAIALHERGLNEALALEQPRLQLVARLQLGAWLERVGRLDAARGQLLTAVRLARRLTDARRLVAAYGALAGLAAADPGADAVTRARRALRLAARVQSGVDLGDAASAAHHLQAAEVLLALGEPEDAWRHAAAAVALTGGDRGAAPLAQRVFGAALLRQGRASEAITALSRALGPAARALALPDRAEAAWHLAQALLTQARTTEGRVAAQRQIAAAERMLARMHLRPPALNGDRGARRAGAAPPPPIPAGAPPDSAVVPPGAGVEPAWADDPGPQRWEAIGILTRSRMFHSELVHLARIAPSQVPILIHGETGAGKELVARAAHRLSGRPGGFVVFNAASRRGELLEAELFGHRRGAFTGAHRDREGLIQQAQDGTLFLDEIADLDGPAQAALLRFLDSGELRAVGSDQTRSVSTRIVAASHQQLAPLVARGGFRRDLYFRLAGAEIRVPPLRARREDIPLLVAAFAERHGLSRDRLRSILAGGLGERLQTHAWPGNVRQLAHCVAQLAALAAGTATAAQIERFLARTLQAAAPESGPRRARDPGVVDGSRRPTRAELDALVQRHGGNIAQVARELDTNRTRVYRLARALGLNLQAHRMPPPPAGPRSAGPPT